MVARATLITTLSPSARPLTTSLSVSPRRPSATAIEVRRVPSSLVTVLCAPVVCTARLGTWSTPSFSATTTLALAVMPGLSFSFSRSMDSVTL